jgi:hypothetical protein
VRTWNLTTRHSAQKTFRTDGIAVIQDEHIIYNDFNKNLETDTVKYVPLIHKSRRIPLEREHSVLFHVTLHDFPSCNSPLLLKFQPCPLNVCHVSYKHSDQSTYCM